jgi:hypothetical protein
MNPSDQPKQSVPLGILVAPEEQPCSACGMLSFLDSCDLCYNCRKRFETWLKQQKQGGADDEA